MLVFELDRETLSSSMSTRTNTLIRDGAAQVVTSVDDVTEALIRP
ncbi:hypothetical protein [Streptomyces sp. NPDC055036]